MDRSGPRNRAPGAASDSGRRRPFRRTEICGALASRANHDGGVNASTPKHSSDVRTRTVSVGEFDIFLNEAGDPGRPAVLFLHGSGPGATGASNWHAVLQDMASEFYCIAPDVLGFGDSSHPEPRPRGLGPYTQLRVDTLIGLLDAMGIAVATVVGNSMGGMWGLGMVRQAPTRVDRLVLMGAGGAPVPIGPSLPKLINFYDEPTVEAMTELLRDFVHEPELFGPDLEGIAAERLPRAVRPDAERSHRATFDFSDPWTFTEDDLAAIEQETLLIHGREDKFARFEGSLYYFQHIPNAQLLGVGKCGHWIQIEHHAQFVSAVRNFLG